MALGPEAGEPSPSCRQAHPHPWEPSKPSPERRAGRQCRTSRDASAHRRRRGPRGPCRRAPAAFATPHREQCSRSRAAKCRVDGADRPVAARRHAGGEDHRVLLGDAYVKIALGVMRTEEVQARAAGHRGGDSHNALVFVRQAYQRVGEDLGVTELPAGLVSPVSGS